VDLVLTVVFFICAILAVAGALSASLGPDAPWRMLGLLALAVGTTGALATLSSGFAAVVALVCLGASGVLLGGRDEDVPTRARAQPSRVPGSLTAQVGAVSAALLLAVLVVVAFGVRFADGGRDGAGFDVAALGRAFFGRDALAVLAVGASLTTALAVGALARSRRS
jgi:hypothetical protein